MAKTHINKNLTQLEPVPVGLLVTSTDVSSNGQFTFQSYAMRSAINAPNRGNYAGEFRATGAGEINYGVSGLAAGGNFTGSGVGVQGHAALATSFNTGIVGIGDGPATAIRNIGGAFEATSGQEAIGIYATANSGATNYAGYFDGDIFVNGGNSGTGYVLASDQMFKTNVDSIGNATSIINALQPKEYFLDTVNTYDMSFTSQKRYGFIAQEVETILPELVGSSSKLPQYDSTGNVSVPGVTFKNLDYNSFIAILVKSNQEQNELIDSLDSQLELQDSINADLQTQINQLYSMMMACCESNQAMQLNGAGVSFPKNWTV